MRNRLCLLVAVGLVLGLAGVANADVKEVSIRIDLEFADLPPASISGIGLATVNGSSGGSHITTLRIGDENVTGTTTAPVTDPIVGAQIPEVVLVLTDIDDGTFAPISGAAASTTQITQRDVAIKGIARVCLVFPGCNSGSLDAPLTLNDGNAGFGIGGLQTLNRLGPIRVSVVQEPWTVKTRTLSDRTDNGGIVDVTFMGTVHGPVSGTSSTALTSGVVQLIAAGQVNTFGVPGNSDILAILVRMTMHVVPEPGMLLLLGSGVVGLVLLGRGRLKNR